MVAKFMQPAPGLKPQDMFICEKLNQPKIIR